MFPNVCLHNECNSEDFDRSFFVKKLKGKIKLATILPVSTRIVNRKKHMRRTRPGFV